MILATPKCAEFRISRSGNVRDPADNVRKADKIGHSLFDELAESVC